MTTPRTVKQPWLKKLSITDRKSSKQFVKPKSELEAYLLAVPYAFPLQMSLEAMEQEIVQLSATRYSLRATVEGLDDQDKKLIHSIKTRHAKNGLDCTIIALTPGRPSDLIPMASSGPLDCLSTTLLFLLKHGFQPKLEEVMPQSVSQTSHEHLYERTSAALSPRRRNRQLAFLSAGGPLEPASIKPAIAEAGINRLRQSAKIRESRIIKQSATRKSYTPQSATRHSAVIASPDSLVGPPILGPESLSERYSKTSFTGNRPPVVVVDAGDSASRISKKSKMSITHTDPVNELLAMSSTHTDPVDELLARWTTAYDAPERWSDY